MQQYRVLVIIPKSETTVIGVFHQERCIFKDELRYVSTEANIMEQVANRQQQILERLNQAGINFSRLHAVSAIGGLLRAVEGGTYEVNEAMIEDLKNSYNGKHASNLGGLIAANIAKGLNLTAYIIDPPVVDEMEEIARFSGHPDIDRISIFHALNQKAVARKAAQELHTLYERVNLIVAHIGNGVSIGAHQNGRVIDVNNGLHGDGPFSLERAGTLPSQEVIDLCFSENNSKEELINKITYHGGLKGYLKVNNAIEMQEQLKKNHSFTKTILQAMGYQISKEIGAMATVLKGNVDAIVLTGEFAKLILLTDYITKHVNWISDVTIYPGEADLQALNVGTLRVLNKEEAPKVYRKTTNEGDRM